ncbi:MAG: hypothetical protein U1E05_04620, partial [Patescibacteria group bacterium]|nr:hypothetical protein [Patescibacteria group bacterium]
GEPPGELGGGTRLGGHLALPPSALPLKGARVEGARWKGRQVEGARDSTSGCWRVTLHRNAPPHLPTREAEPGPKSRLPCQSDRAAGISPGATEELASAFRCSLG